MSALTNRSGLRTTIATLRHLAVLLGSEGLAFHCEQACDCHSSDFLFIFVFYV